VAKKTGKYGAHELLLDLLAYVKVAYATNVPEDSILTNIVHDLGEYSQNPTFRRWVPRVRDCRLIKIPEEQHVDLR
jgi:hypothetical protein